MDKKIVGLLLVLIVITIFIIIFNKGIKYYEFSNNDFSIKYDSTWKIKNKNDFMLVHKKSKSTLNIKCKLLDDNNIDTELSEIVNNVIYSIGKQNSDYKLISSDVLDNGYSYLYENDSNNVLVNVYKKDKKLIIVYYEANIDYYDIVLDSVDAILDSLEIKVGE